MASRRIGSLKTVDEFRGYLAELNIDLPVDDQPQSQDEQSPMAQSIQVGNFLVGNRWAVHPMEGWDATLQGKPSEHTLRRWNNFGESGCKLIWGGEAVAVCPEGRANPNQLYSCKENEQSLAELLQVLKQAHQREYGDNACDDLMVGLQLTHSGRYCRPNEKTKLESHIAYHHPLLDQRIGLDPADDSAILSDEDLEQIVQQFIQAAQIADRVGFQFVDIKHCHGYLGHELLSGFTRPGKYGGSFEGRTRFLREICEGVRATCPNLQIGVRLSLFDSLPFQPAGVDEKTGRPTVGQPADFSGDDYAGFGCNRSSPLDIDLREPIQLLQLMRDELGITLVNLSAGSPYSNPHIQRPAYFPPSDGYQTPEDPLVGCVRQIQAVAEIKKAVPNLPIVGTAYTYFQEYLPHVAQAVIRRDDVDFVGIGRLLLSQWKLPAQVLRGENYRATKKICRTFSDCTTGPRNGLISGCYPLDDHYKQMPEFQKLKEIKSAKRKK